MDYKAGSIFLSHLIYIYYYDIFTLTWAKRMDKDILSNWNKKEGSIAFLVSQSKIHFKSDSS